MKIQIFKYKNLHPSIHEIRLVQSDSESDILTHFVPPLGNPELLFYIDNEYQIKNAPCKKGLIKGQYTIAQKIDFNPNYHFLSVSLHPYGLKQLFNVDASEFINTVVDIESHPMTTFLLSLFQGKKEIDIPFIELLAKEISSFSLYPISSVTKDYLHAIKEQKDLSHSVKELIKDKGIGLRTLQRAFKNETGLTPKEYLSIIRMNRIELRLKDKPNVFELISDFDFTDQSHFIREVKHWRIYSLNELIKKKLLLSDQLPHPDLIYL